MADSAAPIDAEAHGLMRAGRLREALPLAQRAVAGASECLPGHALLASLFLRLGRTRDAESVVSMAAALKTRSADACDGLAYVSMQLNDHERANLLYRRATELSPATPRYWYNLACSERSFGRLAEAEAACDRGIALNAAQYPTYLLRSELRVQTPEANHIPELQARLADLRADDGARAYLGYALAKELDDVGRYEEAFEGFAAAAAARRSRIPYDVAADEWRLKRIAEVFSRDVCVGGKPASVARDAQAGRGAHASAAARSIFIVGLPRSGTTLVERILSGLPKVRSNGETDHVSRALTAAAREIPSGSAADMFQRAAAADPEAVAASYARLAGLNETGGWAIEKQPTNTLYLGAIRRAMPEARIVLVTRSPLDSCFAMFRTLFGESAFPFSYDFEELARYHAAHDGLMRHWRAVLGDALYEVRYEDLVREPRVIGERMARHCGLTWTDEAIDIQRNRSVSLTASAAQVRRPIYGSSSGRWRHYRRQLEPLIDALRRRGVSVPEDA